MRRIGNFVLVLMTAVVFASCFGDDTQPSFEVYTDAYVLKKMVGDEEAYATTFFAYANQIMRTATATEMGGTGEKIDLLQDPRSLYTMSKIPLESEYLPYPPATSDYMFQVTSETGVVNDSYDFLSYDDIEIPEITKTEFTDNNKYLNIAWTETDGVDGYLVKILDAEGREISPGYGFNPEVLEYTLNVVLVNWIIIPEQGETYAVQVHAYAYEPEYEDGYEAYNLQEISIAEEQIIWP